ncbi:MAG: hypothetical protein ABIH42_08310 [Planctomycetota bacterium]
MVVMLQEKSTPVVRNKGNDSFTNVRNVMNQVFVEGRNDEGLLESILSDLKELVSRVEKVKQLAPELAGTDVSPYIFQMLKIADQKQCC